MKFIVLSYPKDKPCETDIINKLFLNGLKTFHLRKPGFSRKEMENFLNEIHGEYHSRIVIHSHYKLALKYPLKGIHLTTIVLRSKLKSDFIYRYFRLVKPAIHISASLHRLDDLYSCRKKYNYVFLSPVFKSISKQNHLPVFSEYTLKTALSMTSQKVIALGGGDYNKVEKIQELGFAGMAVLGAIWNHQDPVCEYIRIREKTDSMNGTLQKHQPVLDSSATRS